MFAALLVVVLAIGALTVRAWTTDAAEAEARADALAADPPPAQGRAPTLGGRLLTARRAPLVLTDPIARARLDQVLAPLVAEMPAASCLEVSVGGVTTTSVRPDLALIPASTMKLLTATAALDVLGPEHHLSTELVSTAPVIDGVLDGDLYVVGGGDPVLYTSAYATAFGRQPQVHTPLDEVAEALAAAGVSQIIGDVIGDDGHFDRIRYVPSWPERYVTQNNVGPLSALSVDDGFEAFDPPVHSADPARWAATAILGVLEANGIGVGGEARSGTAPDGAALVAEVASLPMAEIVAQMLRESDNTSAELVVKELGVVAAGAGSTAAGTDVVAGVMGDLGLDTTALVVADGSGLDRSNRVTCGLLHGVLVAAGPESTLADGLPVAGETGTLARRFAEHPARGQMRAKTGYLNEVNGLAGFVTDVAGRQLTFALVTNGVPIDSRLGFDLQERLATTLVTGPDLPAVAELPLAGEVTLG